MTEINFVRNLIIAEALESYMNNSRYGEIVILAKSIEALNDFQPNLA